jgi:hypothetical protein
MATYRMHDGTVVKTENATKSWEEKTRFDGNNRISVNTGSQWDHQELHQSRKGRYWIESWSQWQGSTPYADWISQRAAAKWLILNDKELPKDLAKFGAEVEE